MHLNVITIHCVACLNRCLSLYRNIGTREEFEVEKMDLAEY